MRRLACISICSAAAIAAVMLSWGASGARAGGFGVEQSAYYQGLSFAGAAAGGGDSLASISWNPAAASFAGSGLLMEGSASYLVISADVHVSNPGSQIPPVGTTDTDIGRNAFIGASYYTWRLNEKTVLGLSLTSPFGLGTKPNDTNWAGQYQGITTYIFNVNATPMVSYEIAPGLSLGVGMQFDYFGLKRQTAQTPSGLSNFKADDFGYGFVAGVTYMPTPSTIIGLGYRSTIEHEAEGHTEVYGVAKTPAHANLMLPDMLSLGLRHEVSPTVRVMGEVEWVNWSRLGVIPIIVDAPVPALAVPAGTTVANFDFRWRDGWLFSLGAEYDWSPDLTLRGGVAYEISPVDGPTTRLVQDPDSNRIWTSIGASYRWDATTRFDFAYSHVFFENDAPFDRVPGSALYAGPALLGTADLAMDIISVGLKMDLSSLHPIFQ